MGDFDDVEFKVRRVDAYTNKQELMSTGRLVARFDTCCSAVLPPISTFPRRHLHLSHRGSKGTRDRGNVCRRVLQRNGRSRFNRHSLCYYPISGFWFHVDGSQRRSSNTQGSNGDAARFGLCRFEITQRRSSRSCSKSYSGHSPKHHWTERICGSRGDCDSEKSRSSDTEEGTAVPADPGSTDTEERKYSQTGRVGRVEILHPPRGL